MRFATLTLLIFFGSTAYSQVYVFQNNTFGVEAQYNRLRLADEFGASFLYAIKGRVAVNCFVGYHEKGNGLDGYILVPGLEVVVLKADKNRPGLTLSSAYESIQFTTSSPGTKILPRKSFSITGNLFTKHHLNSGLQLIPVISFGSYLPNVLDSSKEGILVGFQPTLVFKRAFFRTKLFYHKQDFFGGFGLGIGL